MKLKQGSFRSSLLMFLATIADIYNEVSYSQIYRELRWPGYRKESVRGMVRRMIEDEELVKSPDGVKLGRRGQQLVEEFIPVRKYSQNKWDNLWRVIIYDIPEKKKSRRNHLRLMLNKFGYGQWQKSVYITPHPVTKAITRWLKENSLFGYVICIEGKQMGGLDNRQLATQVFKGKERLRDWEMLVARGFQVIRDNKGADRWVEQYEAAVLAEPWLPRELEMGGVEAARHKAALIMEKIINRKK